MQSGREAFRLFAVQQSAKSFSDDQCPSNSGKGDAYDCVSMIDDEFRQSLSEQEAKTLKQFALGISAISIVGTLALGVSGMLVAIENSNMAIFGFALNCLLDVLSTTLVVWRFWPNQADITMAFARERERKASFGMGLLFVCAYFVILGKSTAGLVHREEPNNRLVSILLASISCGFCLILAWAKMHIARKLCSSSLRTDGLNSLCGATMALGVIVSWIVYREEQQVWFISYIVAILVATIMLVCGLRLMVLLADSPSKSKRSGSK